MTGMVKKYHIALFLNSGTSEHPVWIRVKKSTALELSMNPETQDYDYITDQNPTTEVLRYKPSLNQPITMYKGEPDYDFAFGKFYNLQVGEKAKCDVLVIFMQEDMERTVGGEPLTVYKAWRNNTTLTVASFNAVDSIITLDVNFGGTIDHGYAYPSGAEKTPAFVKESESEAVWEDPFTPSEDPEPTPTPTEPATPVFSDEWNETETVAQDGELILDGGATVSDGGTVTYAWTVDGVAEATTSDTFTVDTSTEGTFVIAVTATNTKDGQTKTATQSCTVTVSA